MFCVVVGDGVLFVDCDMGVLMMMEYYEVVFVMDVFWYVVIVCVCVKIDDDDGNEKDCDDDWMMMCEVVMFCVYKWYSVFEVLYCVLMV